MVKITCFKVIVIVIANLKTEVIVIVIDSQVMVLVIVIYNLVVIVIIIHLKYMLGNCFGQKGADLPILFLRIS